MKLLREFLSDCDGATSIEYGLIAVLISIFVITWAQVIGFTLSNSFNAVSNGFAATR